MSVAMATDTPMGRFKAAFNLLEQQQAARQQERLQQEAEERERAERDRFLLDQLADRLMLEYREAGEPPYSWLARDMQVSKATVCRILNGSGKTAPRWWQVNALLLACKVDASTIDEIKRMWIDIRNEQKPLYYDTDVISTD